MTPAEKGVFSLGRCFLFYAVINGVVKKSSDFFNNPGKTFLQRKAIFDLLVILFMGKQKKRVVIVCLRLISYYEFGVRPS